MKILSGFAYEENTQQPNEDALLLQQIEKNGVPILLTCICKGQGNTLSEREYAAGITVRQLMEWFYSVAAPLCTNHLRSETIEKALHRIWNQILTTLNPPPAGMMHSTTVKECSHPYITGLLSYGSHFWLFQEGDCPAYLLNQRYLLPNIKKITPAETSFQVRHGTWQTNLGILLCTPSFIEPLQTNEIAKCLTLTEVRTDWQLSRRLEELQAESARRQPGTIGSALCLTITA